MNLNDNELKLLKIVKEDVNNEPFYGDNYEDRSKETNDWIITLTENDAKEFKNDKIFRNLLNALAKKEIISLDVSRLGTIFTIKKGKNWNLIKF